MHGFMPPFGQYVALQKQSTVLPHPFAPLHGTAVPLHRAGGGGLLLGQLALQGMQPPITHRHLPALQAQPIAGQFGS